MALVTGGASGATVALRAARLSRALAVGGNITCNSSGGYADLAAATGGPGAAGFDLTVSATTNDVLSVSAVLSCPNTTAVGVFFDIGTLVAAAIVNYLGQSAGSNANNGLATCASGISSMATPAVQYVVQAGDLTGGSVVLRLLYLTSAASNRTLGRSISQGPLMFAVANLGQ